MFGLLQNECYSYQADTKETGPCIHVCRDASASVIRPEYTVKILSQQIHVYGKGANVYAFTKLIVGMPGNGGVEIMYLVVFATFVRFCLAVFWRAVISGVLL